MSENKLDNSEDNIPNLSEELSNIANNDDNNNKKQKKRSKLRIILYIIGAVSAFGVIGFVSIIVYVYILSLQLPSTDEFSKFKYTEPMVVYDAKGNIIAELGAERRYPISIEQMPPYVYQSVVAVEDARFYEHSGIDPLGIARAMVSNIKAGKMVEGGSTLTQQLVKVIYLSPERKVKRKIKEAIIAYRLDKELSKDKILELYLNQVNFGRGAYGIQAAAINYFGKEDVKDLTIAEAAMIAGIPKGPSIYAPHLNMKRAVARRNHVLKRMLEVKYITQEEYNAAVNETVKLSESIPLRLRHAGYFMDFVHKYIEEDLKIEDAQNKGIKVFTTLNLDYQIAAEDALIKNLMSIAKREGYKGTLGKILIEDDTDVEQVEDIIDNAVVSEENDNNTIKYVRLDNDVPSYLKDLGYQKAVITEAEKNTLKIKLSDGSEGTINFKDNNWITNAKNARAKSFLDVFAIDDMIYVSPVLKDNASTGVYMIEQNPDLEGAVVSINPQTGEIYAMAGGMSYFKSFFNRAVQARRQVGSTFKPLVYAAAYESGYYPMSVFYDTPVIQKSVKQGEEDWRPKNFDGQFMGEMTLERALQLSNNSITIKLAQAIGIKKIIRYAQMFGFTGEIPADLSVSIGSLSASPLELAVAYSTFSNQGMRPSKPFFVTRVADIDNKTLFEFQKPEMTRVLDEKSASLITDSLVKVVEKGGAWKSRNAVNRILGGKTGTSNDSKDGWFAGVLPNFVTVAWVGYDDYRKMGSYAVGGNTAQNIFIDYFKSINEKVPLALFKAPAGASYFKVNNDMHEITDSLIGNLGYSIYPVDSSNNPTVYDFKK
ncbi:penicillin-binding protein 1A [Mucispirillum schaedleri]|uniref:penicillin-binding protein 1A n=1 Tax=Mucispirillum schaedleri TaxID=248039 RepID=UPI001F565A95|nr:PBP1A family penicillin-binding protein [Mucispirillum schaedleri]